MIVKLRRKDTKYPDLTLGHHYAVIGIEADALRLLNDRGRPYLYPARLFKIIDPCEPGDWVTEFGEDGERYAYPSALNEPGFFEDFFDDKREAVVTFWRMVNKQLANDSSALRQPAPAT